MDYYYPKHYVVNIDSFDGEPALKARVKNIVQKCEAHEARPNTPEEAKEEVRGLSAAQRYELGKQTLQIEELKRSSVHFFNTPKGALESPQLIINHGMICPHSCRYCYWQKDLFSRARITVYANPKERFETDLKIAMSIWRAFSAFLSLPRFKHNVDDRLFVKFDKAIRRKSEDLNKEALNEACLKFAEKTLDAWKAPQADKKVVLNLLKDSSYKPKAVFNSGENNDSVALEHITDVQKDILIPTILSMDDAYLMLRTKSIHYDFLEQFKDHEKKDRIIISPSLIQQEFIEKYEQGNYGLKERLEALKKVAEWGFKIFPCFSPLIFEKNGWKHTIKDFITSFKMYLPPDRIQYYTIGSLRLSKTALRNIRMIDPDTELDSPYFVHPKNTSGDKYRYPKITRAAMYASFIREIDDAGYDKVPRFLQTETVEAWKALTTDKYKDLGLDLEGYQSGALDLKALTGSNGLPKGSLVVLNRGEPVRPKKRKAEEASEKPRPPSLNGHWTDRFVYCSALQKAIRSREVNDARYFAQKLTEMGAPGGNLNRLLIIAAEDVGLADPQLITYVRHCEEKFESLLELYKIGRSNVFKNPIICGVIDKAVIAAATSYKSRLLPQASFATLYEIYNKETFRQSISEYEKLFLRAVHRQNEREALYYAYILAIFLGSKDSVLRMIRKESKKQNEELIDKWIKEYKRSDQLLFLAGSVVMLFRPLDYPHGEYKQLISNHLSSPITEAEVPNRAFDRHTSYGKKVLGRGRKHFLTEAATVKNERFRNDWDDAGTKAYLDADKEKKQYFIGKKKKQSLAKAKNITEATTKRFLITKLPFDYRRAVLTQARTSDYKPYAFVVELPKGNRKFMKGPFKNEESAKEHVMYNEIKKKLASKYLHPIQCEVKTYDDGSVFLVCEELGKANLSKVKKRKPTMVDNQWFEVLDDSSNHVVPDPFSFLKDITKRNKNIWVEVIVNYCFRWIFKIGDAVPKNLMLEKSTGKVYSTDEIRLKRKDAHPTIWNNRHTAEGVLPLVEDFANSPLLKRVLVEVERWRGSLDVIRSEVYNFPDDVDARIDRLLEHPRIVLGI